MTFWQVVRFNRVLDEKGFSVGPNELDFAVSAVPVEERVPSLLGAARRRIEPFDRVTDEFRALPGLDTDVVGADPLAGKLQDAQELLGADLGIVGQALAELADRASQISAAFTQADQQLSQAAGAVR